MMGNRRSKTLPLRAPLPLAHVERMYALPAEQLARFSEICTEQQYLESRLELYSDELPTADKWQVSWQTAQRLVIRALDYGVVRHVWFVTAQTPGRTIELHTSEWYLNQPGELLKLPYQRAGDWFVSHTSAVGIALKCYGAKSTDPVKTLWHIDSADHESIVLHSSEWYSRQRPQVGAHRLVNPMKGSQNPLCTLLPLPTTS